MLKKDKLVGAIVYYDGELTAPLLLGFLRQQSCLFHPRCSVFSVGLNDYGK